MDIPGEQRDQIEYRSEVGGQLGISSFISNLILPINVHPKITTACGGVYALNKVSIDPEYIRCSNKHIDLIFIIVSHWHKSVFTPIKVRVYIH